MDGYMQESTLDVIIPTYKPGAEFGVVLKRLHSQTVQPGKIIIINTEEEFWNPEWEEEYPDISVTHIAKQEFDHGGTRNMAAAQSDAKYLVFMTQDAVPADANVLSGLLKPLKKGEAAVAYARQIPKKNAGMIESYTRHFNYPAKGRIKSQEDLPKLGVKTFFCSNVCAAYNHKIFDEMGGFDTPVILNEDMLYAGRIIEAGMNVAYVADARVYHSHAYSGRQQLHRNFDIGVSQKQNKELFEKYPSEKEGIALVKKTASYICKNGKVWMLFPLFWKSGCKYIGYFLGKHYDRLPRRLDRKLGLDKEYWDRTEGTQEN